MRLRTPHNALTVLVCFAGLPSSVCVYIIRSSGIRVGEQAAFSAMPSASRVLQVDFARRTESLAHLSGDEIGERGEVQRHFVHWPKIANVSLIVNVTPSKPNSSAPRKTAIGSSAFEGSQSSTQRFGISIRQAFGMRPSRM